MELDRCWKLVNTLRVGSAEVVERPLFGSDSEDLFISTLDIEAMAASPVVLVTGASRGVL